MIGVCLCQQLLSQLLALLTRRQSASDAVRRLNRRLCRLTEELPSWARPRLNDPSTTVFDQESYTSHILHSSALAPGIGAEI